MVTCSLVLFIRSLWNKSLFLRWPFRFWTLFESTQNFLCDAWTTDKRKEKFYLGVSYYFIQVGATQERESLLLKLIFVVILCCMYSIWQEFKTFLRVLYFRSLFQVLWWVLESSWPLRNYKLWQTPNTLIFGITIWCIHLYCLLLLGRSLVSSNDTSSIYITASMIFLTKQQNDYK